MAIAGYETQNGMMEGQPAQLPLAGVFNLKAVLSQNELIEAKSGFSPNKYANNAVSGNGDNGPENEDDKKKREKEELERRMQMFSMAGLNMSFDDVVRNMDAIGENFDKSIDKVKNLTSVTDDMYARDDNGRIIETAEELKALEEVKGYDSVKLSVDKVTMYNGTLISTDGHQWILKVEQNKEEFAETLKGVKSGEIDPSTLPPELQEKIKEFELNGGKPPETEFNLGTTLENFQGQSFEGNMLPLWTAEPSVTYDAGTFDFKSPSPAPKF